MKVSLALVPVMLVVALASGCASSPPAPAPAPAPAPEPAAPSGRVRPDQWYDLLFQGFGENEVEEVVGMARTNAAADGWARIEEKSNRGESHAYRVGYTGDGMLACLRRYLKELNLGAGRWAVETGDRSHVVIVRKK